MAVTIRGAYRIDRFSGQVDPFIDYVTMPKVIDRATRNGNVGCRILSADLVTVSGDVTISTAQTITGRKYTGRVSITGSGLIKFVDCEFAWTSSPVSDLKIVNGGNAAVSNLQFEFCSFHAVNPNQYTDGPFSHHTTYYRCHFYDTVDGIKIMPVSGVANVQVLCSLIEDLSFFSPCDYQPQSNNTHNDGIQISGGTGIVIRGNRIRSYMGPKSQDTLNNSPPGGQALSTILVQTNSSLVTGMNITDNWLDGGMISVNINGDTVGRNLGTFHRNKFDHGQGIGSGDTTQTINMPNGTIMDTGEGTSNANHYYDPATGNILNEILVRHNA